MTPLRSQQILLEVDLRSTSQQHDAFNEAHMTVKDFEALLDYGYWANRRLFDVLAELTDEQFTQVVAGGYGSVRNTLVHVLSAEWGWLDRCGGTPRGPSLVAADYPTVASVRDRWQQVEQHVREFLSRLHDADLERTVEWALGGGPKHTSRTGELLQHAVIHGVHHRGQIALLLRLLGVTPGNFDILFYYERPPAEWRQPGP
jgi:uncharacterized damage-inducible protein DinB